MLKHAYVQLAIEASATYRYRHTYCGADTLEAFKVNNILDSQSLLEARVKVHGRLMNRFTCASE